MYDLSSGSGDYEGDIMLCSPVKQSFKLTSRLAYYSILKMEVIFSSETSVDFHRPTRRYVQEDRILQQ
jgi:hypothetical protein